MKFLIGLLGLSILLGLPLTTYGQDDAWTCDNGEHDVLNAAQASFDEGDLVTAEELVIIAEKLCASVPARAVKASRLHGTINNAQRPTATPRPAELIQGETLINEAAHLFFSEEDYASATEKYEEALVLYENLDEAILDAVTRDETLVFIHMQLGDCYRELEDYEQALEHLGTALLLSKTINAYPQELQLGIEDRIVFIQNAMDMEIEWTCDGGLYDLARAGRYTYSIDEDAGYSMVELAINLCWDNPVGLVVASNILSEMDSTGRVQVHWRAYEQGLQAFNQERYSVVASYFNDVLKLYEHLDFKFGQATVMYSLGQLYLAQERYDEALPYFIDGLVIAEELDHPILIAMHNEGLGDLYAVQGMPDEAAEAYAVALDQLAGIERESDNLDAMKERIEDKIESLGEIRATPIF